MSTPTCTRCLVPMHHAVNADVYHCLGCGETTSAMEHMQRGSSATGRILDRYGDLLDRRAELLRKLATQDK